MTINREHLATQKILDLILDECRYWQGRDEARRGGFAILYSAAKEIADQAQAATAAFTLEIGADGGYCVIERDVKWLRAMRNKRTHQIHDLYTAPQHDAERDALRAQIELLRELLLQVRQYVRIEDDDALLNRIDAAMQAKP